MYPVTVSPHCGCCQCVCVCVQLCCQVCMCLSGCVCVVYVSVLPLSLRCAKSKQNKNQMQKLPGWHIYMYSCQTTSFFNFFVSQLLCRKLEMIWPVYLRTRMVNLLVSKESNLCVFQLRAEDVLNKQKVLLYSHRVFLHAESCEKE